jgi:hypothetical protein
MHGHAHELCTASCQRVLQCKPKKLRAPAYPACFVQSSANKALQAHRVMAGRNRGSGVFIFDFEASRWHMKVPFEGL